MLLFLTYFFVFMIINAAADNNMTQVTEVASLCCPEEFRECCIESMQFYKPLACSSNHEERLEMVKCIQGSLFGEPSVLSLSVEDLSCCSIFDTNDNDPEGNCFHHCENTIMIPSLHPREKTRRVRKCMLTNYKDTVYKCFIKCKAFRRIQSEENRFHLEQYCTIADFMRANQFYYGKVVTAPTVEKK